jgi:hypothetical protein
MVWIYVLLECVIALVFSFYLYPLGFNLFSSFGSFEVGIWCRYFVV